MDNSLVQFGVTVPREFLKRLDNAKGPYFSRNKFILKLLEERLNENEGKNLQGASLVGRPERRVDFPCNNSDYPEVTEAVKR
jgi:metal-responsive CopG/Arc/MetJ family transcriptional regulator